MATRRKYPSKSKKQTIISPKSVKWILGLFLLLCAIIFVYQKKETLREVFQKVLGKEVHILVLQELVKMNLL